MSALSPGLKPAFIILVYPPFLSLALTATEVKSLPTASSDLSLLNANLLFATESSLARVISGSIKVLSSLL